VSIWTDLGGIPFEQSFRDVKGIRTRLVSAGTGEAVIFLHGTGGHAEAFTRNFKRHAQHFRTIAIDMIGHGYTDAPDIEYTMDSFVEHLHNVVLALGYDKVSVVGESLGGMVAAHFAIRYPQHTRRVVMNTGVLMTRTEADLKGLRDMLERTRKATGNVTRDAIRARLAWLMHDPQVSVTEELVDIRHGIYSQPGRAKIMARISQMVVNGVHDERWVQKYSNPEDLRRIQCPALIIWSKYNPSLQLENASKALPYLRDGRMVVMEHSSHWPQWEESERYDKVQIAFLRGEPAQ
jgi:2-hydroxy-6-oxonona-2,4-dienedioate hydrolase